MERKHKDIQRRRMMSYFIKATEQILAEEGIDAVNIRKVAQMAGYNSATLYRYFEDLDHLIYYAMMKHLVDYNMVLAEKQKQCHDAERRVYLVWEEFTKAAFRNPLAFLYLFFSRHGRQDPNALSEYYEIFPEEFGTQDDTVISGMLKGGDILLRNRLLIAPLVEEGKLRAENLEQVNAMMIYSMHAMLRNKEMGVDQSSEEESVSEMMGIVHYLVETEKELTQRS